MCKLIKVQEKKKESMTQSHKTSPSTHSYALTTSSRVQWTHTSTSTRSLVQKPFAGVTMRRDWAIRRHAHRLSVSDTNRHLVTVPETSTCRCWGHLKLELYCQRWDQRQAGRMAPCLCPLPLSLSLYSCMNIAWKHLKKRSKMIERVAWKQQ